MGVSGAGPYAATWFSHSLEGPPNSVKSAMFSKLRECSNSCLSSILVGKGDFC
jgi:hypothetical protein